MKKIFLSVSGFTFQIKFEPKINKEISSEVVNHLDIEIKKFFKDFILLSCPKDIDFTIELQRKLPIILTKKKNNFLHLYQNFPRKLVTYQHISFTQFVIIFRFALQKLLSQNEGMLLHASASNFHNKAILFMGQNGAGKSTIVNLLSDTYPIIADDSIIIKKEKGFFYVYQSPFFEKGLTKKNPKKKYIVDSIFFLRKSKNLNITLIKKEEVLPQFTHQLLVEEAFRNKLLQNAFRFVNLFNKFYTLSFMKDKEKVKHYLTNTITT